MLRLSEHKKALILLTNKIFFLHKILQNDSHEDEDDDWGEDISQEAVAKRMQELTDAAKTLAMSEDLEKTANERIDLFYSFVKVCVYCSVTPNDYKSMFSLLVYLRTLQSLANDKIVDRSNCRE